MAQRPASRSANAPALPYDPVIENNRFVAETDIEPGYLELLVGVGFPSRRVRLQPTIRSPHHRTR